MSEGGKLKDMTPEDVVRIVKEQREKYIKPEVWEIVRELEEKIKNGEIKFKTPQSHDEYEQIIKELEKGNLDAALEKE
ncbi:MAG: basic rane protein [Pyrococcus sp.]|nr:basic rane protein [Pyrococcus sp.]